MAKLKLQPEPTFRARVDIPVPGAVAAPVEFVFKYRTRTAMKALAEALQAVDLDDVDLMLDIASGWDLIEPFDREHVAQLLDNYPGAGRAIFDKYLVEQTGAKEKNS